jgi:hypothetical protein
MKMTKLMRRATIAPAAVAFVAILGTSFVLVPLAMASSSRSDDLSLIEIIRANTAYKTAHIDLPSAPLALAPASPSPDMKLISESDGLSGVTQQTLLQAADDL